MTLFIGLMSGTSMDSVDAVLTQIDESGLRVIAHHAHAIPASLHSRLSKALNTATLTALEVWQLDAKLGVLFAECANALLTAQAISPGQITAIGSHGQTLFHAPDSEPALTVQVADPNIIALRTGIVTVSDFRRMDIAAGGQGAPLAPAFHHFSFSHPNRVRSVLNIGGIANLTVLPPASSSIPCESALLGFDTGPGNALLDTWIRENKSHEFDDQGRWAASGKVVESLLKNALADPYFARLPPKSTGREYFNRRWLDNLLAHHAQLPAEDVQRTLCQVTAQSAATALKSHAPDCTEMFICGGGALNVTLIEALRLLLPKCRIANTDDLGVPAKSVEGAAFAWLAAERLHNHAAVPSSITGARQPVCLGGIYHPNPRPTCDS